jgi:predicted dehydrogenase
MSRSTHRRQFLKTTAAISAGCWLSGGTARAARRAPSEKLNIGIIGAAGRGGANLGGVASENIVALCDVNQQNLAGAAQRFPQAKTYSDWRKLVDQKGLDAVVVSTTDHTHAPASVWAMRRGLSVYCEKPVAHSVYEARTVRETYVANKDKIATQMGTQIHAEPNYRRVVELIQGGAIGPVREAHVWCNRVGPCPERSKAAPPVPSHLNWDLWLGPAPQRPFHPEYLGGCTVWEQRWDFGNGCLGDMGSHLIDLPFWALKLRQPLSVEAEGDVKSDESYPHWLVVRWEHPARGDMPPVKLCWYDGEKRPESPPGHDLRQWGIGVLFKGDKGMLLADYGRRILLPEGQFKDFAPPKETIPPSRGHYQEWIHGCKTGEPTLCNFDYSGMLVEHNLLGTVAFRVGKKLEWDPQALKAANCPEADRYIRRKYREGWTLEG